MFNRIYTESERLNSFDLAVKAKGLQLIRMTPDYEMDYCQEECGLFVIYKFQEEYDTSLGKWLVYVWRFIFNPNEISDVKEMYIVQSDLAGTFTLLDSIDKHVKQIASLWVSNNSNTLLKRRDTQNIEDIINETFFGHVSEMDLASIKIRENSPHIDLSTKDKTAIFQSLVQFRYKTGIHIDKEVDYIQFEAGMKILYKPFSVFNRTFKTWDIYINRYMLNPLDDNLFVRYIGSDLSGKFGLDHEPNQYELKTIMNNYVFRYNIRTLVKRKNLQTIEDFLNDCLLEE